MKTVGLLVEKKPQTRAKSAKAGNVQKPEAPKKASDAKNSGAGNGAA